MKQFPIFTVIPWQTNKKKERKSEKQGNQFFFSLSCSQTSCERSHTKFTVTGEITVSLEP